MYEDDVISKTRFLIFSAYSFLLEYQRHVKNINHTPCITSSTLVNHLFQSIFSRQVKVTKMGLALQDATASSLEEFSEIGYELFTFFVESSSKEIWKELQKKMLTYIHETLTQTVANDNICCDLVGTTILLIRSMLPDSCVNYNYMDWVLSTEATIFLTMFSGSMSYAQLPSHVKSQPHYAFFAITSICMNDPPIVYFQKISMDFTNDEKAMSLVARHKGINAFLHCGDTLVHNKTFFLDVLVRYYPTWLMEDDLDLEYYKEHLADKDIIMQTLNNLKVYGYNIDTNTMQRIHKSLLDDKDVKQLL